MEVSQRVSDVRALDFLNWIEGMDYSIFVLDRARCEAVPMESAASLLGDWGDPYRIEDLLFLPREKRGLVEAV